MNIPDEVILTAAEAGLRTPLDELSSDDRVYWEEFAEEVILTSSAFIQAQALRDAAEQIRSDRGDPWAVGWLEARANTLDPS